MPRSDDVPRRSPLSTPRTPGAVAVSRPRRWLLVLLALLLATATVLVAAPPDRVDAQDPPGISVEKTPSTDSLPAGGGTVEFTVTVTNTGSLPLELTSLDDDVYGDLLDNMNPAVTENTCPFIPRTIPVGDDFACSFDAEITDDHSNTVTAVAEIRQTTVEGSATAVVEVMDTSADVSVEKSVDPAEIPLEATAVYTITVTNNGPDAGSSVTLTDPVPLGLTILEATSPAGTCTADGQTVTCALGTMAAGESAEITITVEGTEAGRLTNTATVTGVVNDPDTTNDSDSAVLDVVDECITIGEGSTLIAGATRIETAIIGSQAVFCDGGAQAVVLTRADLFPDAQAGAPLAIDKDAPMLLSQPDALHPLTEEEIIRVLPEGGTVYLLGGTVALSQPVEDRLTDLGFATIRYGGTNRFGTAAIIAEEGLDDPDTLLVANGGNFPDSVLAGAASNSAGGATLAAVLLTSDDDIPPETAAYLDGRDDDPTMITIGGPAAAAFPEVESVVGASRFDTSVAVAERFFTDPRIVGVATGLDFADALTGGALIGRTDVGPGPMLLTEPDDLPAVVADYLSDNAATIARAAIFGGTNAISASVGDEIDQLLGFM